MDMDCLPLEIILNILSRLPIKPLIRCKSVCKSFLNLTLDPYFINTHLNHASHDQNPSLILNTTILDRTGFHSQLYYTTLTQTQSNTSAGEIPFSPLGFGEFRVSGSCNGLLLLIRRKISRFMFVINPCTGKQILIPKLINQSIVVGTGIGFSPKSNEYKVVKVIGGSASSYVFSLREGVWRAVGAPSFFKISGCLESGVCANGVIHWANNSQSNFIVCFDVADEVFDMIPYPAGGLQQSKGFLALFNGCLGLSYKENNCLDIWILKDYNVRESWTRSFIIDMHYIGWNCRDVQVLYVQKNGEVLMLHRNHALWFYDPKTMSFKKHNIVGLPSWFEAVCNVGSLVSPLLLRRNR